MNDIDHRVLGNKLDLFHQQEEGAGMVFWHPRGWELYRVLEDYIRARMRRAGFREIRTPQLLALVVGEKRPLGEVRGGDVFLGRRGRRARAVFEADELSVSRAGVQPACAVVSRAAGSV
ncbi:hypothetical protein [Paraburkholderia sediminicola]|uniref:hypothetical protein n=1 Tax=Paraburkholderia sediminicola TaxID=458836 RepID=UPI0038BA90A5